MITVDRKGRRKAELRGQAGVLEDIASLIPLWTILNRTITGVRRNLLSTPAHNFDGLPNSLQPPLLFLPAVFASTRVTMAGNSIFLTSTLAGSAALLLYGIYGYRRNVKITGNTPCLKTLFSIARIMNNFLPSWKIPWTDWMLSVDGQWWLVQNHRGTHKNRVIEHLLNGDSIRTVWTGYYIWSKLSAITSTTTELDLHSSLSTIFQVRWL